MVLKVGLFIILMQFVCIVKFSIVINYTSPGKLKFATVKLTICGGNTTNTMQLFPKCISFCPKFWSFNQAVHTCDFDRCKNSRFNNEEKNFMLCLFAITIKIWWHIIIPANLWNLQWGRSPPQLWQLRGRFCTNDIFSLNIWPVHYIHLQNTNKS